MRIKIADMSLLQVSPWCCRRKCQVKCFIWTVISKKKLYIGLMGVVIAPTSAF